MKKLTGKTQSDETKNSDQIGQLRRWPLTKHVLFFSLHARVCLHGSGAQPEMKVKKDNGGTFEKELGRNLAQAAAQASTKLTKFCENERQI